MATDPVCGMKGKKEIESEYDGKKYYFCNDNCKKEFDANPLKYIRLVYGSRPCLRDVCIRRF